ncbi:MAG: FAD:protein FMN transferase, partial [Opitutales bacterium]
MSEIYNFEHKAMKTTFKLRLQHPDKQHAQNAALNAIELIDEIENKLSRYIGGSDVWQINHMVAGQTIFLSELCYDCLRLGLEAYAETQGLFDVTLGRQIEHRKRKEEGEPPEVSGQLVVVPDRPAIHCNEPGREIDLGGIGKGFALDRAKQLLEEWEIPSGILSAGASTHLAFGKSEWTMGLTAKNETRNITIHAQALSASGTGIQDEHIIAPDGSMAPSYYPRTWVIHRTAAWADVWSTAAMLMQKDELTDIAAKMDGLYIENAENGSV